MRYILTSYFTILNKIKNSAFSPFWPWVPSNNLRENWGGLLYSKTFNLVKIFVFLTSGDLKWPRVIFFWKVELMFYILAYYLTVFKKYSNLVFMTIHRDFWSRVTFYDLRSQFWKTKVKGLWNSSFLPVWTRMTPSDLKLIFTRTKFILLRYLLKWYLFKSLSILDCGKKFTEIEISVPNSLLLNRTKNIVGEPVGYFGITSEETGQEALFMASGQSLFWKFIFAWFCIKFKRSNYDRL